MVDLKFEINVSEQRIFRNNKFETDSSVLIIGMFKLY